MAHLVDRQFGQEGPGRLRIGLPSSAPATSEAELDHRRMMTQFSSVHMIAGSQLKLESVVATDDGVAARTFMLDIFQCVDETRDVGTQAAAVSHRHTNAYKVITGIQAGCHGIYFCEILVQIAHFYGNSKRPKIKMSKIHLSH